MDELPNFDLNFDAIIWSDDEEQVQPQLQQPKRFKTLSEEEVSQIAAERTEVSTKRNTVWGVKLLKGKTEILSQKLKTKLQ